MESVKDFFQSIFDSYSERIKSPLIGSFILSFVIYNWRPLGILFFSNWPIHCRIEWIDEKYCVESSFFWPLGIALFYILVLPHINLLFEWLLTLYTNEKFKKRNKLRLIDLTQQKKEAILKREIADEEAGTSELNKLKSRNDALVKEIEVLTEQNKSDVERHNSTVEILKNSENKLQNDLANFKQVNENLKLVYENLKNNPRHLELPANTLNLIDKLSEEDRDYYVQFCDWKVYSSISKLVLNETKVAKFVKLGLLVAPRISGMSYSITEIGVIVYAYIKRTKTE